MQGQSAYFVWLNRGKESVCLDLRSETDCAVLESLVAAADVFIQNLKPGSIEELGFGSADLRKRFPRLITCDISGFGKGPFSHLNAYDLIVQAETGLCAITGTQQGPARVGVSLCNISAFCLVVLPGEPPFEDSIPLADLHAFPLAVPMRNNNVRRSVADVVAQHGCVLDVRFEVDSLSTIIDMIMEGKAYSILTPSAIQKDASQGQVRTVDPVHQRQLARR